MAYSPASLAGPNGARGGGAAGCIFFGSFLPLVTTLRWWELACRVLISSIVPTHDGPASIHAPLFSLFVKILLPTNVRRPIAQVKIHDKLLSDILKPNEMQSVAMAAQFQLFNSQEIIVRQGEQGDAFYMIEEGLVDVYITGKNNGQPLVSLKKGTFFGEKALLSSDVRTATCVAQNNVKCLVLGREDFVRMLGNLGDLMNREYEDREGEATPEDEEPELIGAHAFDTNVHPKTKK